MKYLFGGLVIFIPLYLKTTVVLSQNLMITDFYWCKDVPHQPVHFFLKPRNYNPGRQLVDINMSLPESFGDGILTTISLELNTELTAKDVWIPIFKTDEDFCKMFDVYVGEVWYDIQRAMGLLAHTCPMPRGTYHAINYTIEFHKLKLQGWPFGKTKATARYFKKATKETMACIVFEVVSK